jgi:hypothetical protein
MLTSENPIFLLVMFVFLLPNPTSAGYFPLIFFKYVFPHFPSIRSAENPNDVKKILFRLRRVPTQSMISISRIFYLPSRSPKTLFSYIYRYKYAKLLSYNGTLNYSTWLMYSSGYRSSMYRLERWAITIISFIYNFVRCIVLATGSDNSEKLKNAFVQCIDLLWLTFLYLWLKRGTFCAVFG